MSDLIAPRVAAAIGHLGGGFMLSRQAKAVAAEYGFANPWASYFAGRCGVLGEVDADVVLAAVVFFEPSTVRAAWGERRDKGVASEAASDRFRQACLEWGRARLAGLDGVGRLAELLEPLAAGADPTCAPIFAGWRALPLPEARDDLARVSFAANLLREHRMAVHGVAVRALGMRPLDAVLTGGGGPGNAAFFGWPAPYPDVAHLSARRAEVESLTDTLEEPTFAGLSSDEAAELEALLAAASAHARTTK